LEPQAVNEEPPKPLSRRRLLLSASFGVLACGVAGLGLRARHEPAPAPAGDAGALRRVLVVFIGALFGRTLPAQDADDLSARLGDLQTFDTALNHDCTVLAQYLESRARNWGATGFEECSASQQQSIVDEIMRIDVKTYSARLLSHLSRDHRDYYRMRWSAVPQLAWIYRHSPAAWRARGYLRWPGVRGDWHDVLVPGESYP
jgi:hypothetical protein